VDEQAVSVSYCWQVQPIFVWGAGGGNMDLLKIGDEYHGDISKLCN
jgi:hypothetical protein